MTIEGFNEYKAKLKSIYPSIMDIKSELLKTIYVLEYVHLLDKEIQKGFNQVNFELLYSEMERECLMVHKSVTCINNKLSLFNCKRV